MNLPQLAYTPSKQNQRAYWSLFQQNPYSADVTLELRICHDYSGEEPDIKKLMVKAGLPVQDKPSFREILGSKLDMPKV